MRHMLGKYARKTELLFLIRKCPMFLVDCMIVVDR